VENVEVLDHRNPTNRVMLIKLVWRDISSARDIRGCWLKWQPILWAVRNKRFQVFNKLMSIYSIEYVSKDPYGRSLLSYLVEMGYCKFARRLLKKKIDINLKDKDRRSPLMYVAMKNKRYFVQLLLEQSNIEVNSDDKEGHTYYSHYIKHLK
jgi:ankyrin repeat protein